MLDISNCGLRSEGGSHFASAIRENSSLEELDLSMNGIEEGASIVLSDALIENVALDRISLAGNPVGYVPLQGLGL